MSGAGAAAAGADIEAGADTVETGGEEADGTGQGGEAIQGKDSERCDPSRSGGKERKEKTIKTKSLSDVSWAMLQFFENNQ